MVHGYRDLFSIEKSGLKVAIFTYSKLAVAEAGLFLIFLSYGPPDCLPVSFNKIVTDRLCF